MLAGLGLGPQRSVVVADAAGDSAVGPATQHRQPVPLRAHAHTLEHPCHDPSRRAPAKDLGKEPRSRENRRLLRGTWRTPALSEPFGARSAMSSPPASPPAATASNPPGSSDPDWAALPPPRRPFRRLTFLVMGITAAFSLYLIARLQGEVRFALESGGPRDLGELAAVPFSKLSANSWIRAEGALTDRVVRYSRPLESDGYRLAPVEGNPKVWVELRVPSETDGTRFVAPGSFVGRLVPAAAAGLRYGALSDAVDSAGFGLPSDAWLLIDGESPSQTRWVLGLLLLLLGFAAFNVVGIVRLARPVRDASAP